MNLTLITLYDLIQVIYSLYVIPSHQPHVICDPNSFSLQTSSDGARTYTLVVAPRGVRSHSNEFIFLISSQNWVVSYSSEIPLHEDYISTTPSNTSSHHSMALSNLLTLFLLSAMFHRIMFEWSHNRFIFLSTQLAKPKLSLLNNHLGYRSIWLLWLFMGSLGRLVRVGWYSNPPPPSWQSAQAGFYWIYTNGASLFHVIRNFYDAQLVIW